MLYVNESVKWEEICKVVSYPCCLVARNENPYAIIDRYVQVERFYKSSKAVFVVIKENIYYYYYF